MANEKRLDLIDRNAIVTLMCRACNNECCEEPCEPGECFMYDTLTNATTVDAVEVVHGRWEIITDDYDCEMMCCSVCRSEFYDGDNDTVDCLHNYCPNCGADMR